MSNQAHDREFVGHVFSAALTLMAVLLAVLGILIGLHGSFSIPAVVRTYAWLIDGILVAVVICGIVSGLSLAYLRGRAVSINVITWFLAVLIVGVPVGTVILVGVAVHHWVP